MIGSMERPLLSIQREPDTDSILWWVKCQVGQVGGFSMVFTDMEQADAVIRHVTSVHATSLDPASLRHVAVLRQLALDEAAAWQNDKRLGYL